MLLLTNNHFKLSIKRIAILGGGPSGLFVFKRLVEASPRNIEIEIFEKKKELGSGMPYSREGASDEPRIAMGWLIFIESFDGGYGESK